MFFIAFLISLILMFYAVYIAIAKIKKIERRPLSPNRISYLR